MAIQWTADLSVGNPAIDKDHQHLFRIVDDLLEAMRRGQGKQEITRVLDFLQSYVVEHFGREERAMAEIGDPNRAEHKAEHDAFVQDFLALRQRYLVDGTSAFLVIEINNHVCGWLRNHISRTDKRLGILLKARPQHRLESR